MERGATLVFDFNFCLRPQLCSGKRRCSVETDFRATLGSVLFPRLEFLFFFLSFFACICVCVSLSETFQFKPWAQKTSLRLQRRSKTRSLTHLFDKVRTHNTNHLKRLIFGFQCNLVLRPRSFFRGRSCFRIWMLI